MQHNIKKVLLLGSGALQIGQAGEFDYSGSQAIKALKEESLEVILINPNIATIQTSQGFANKVYFLPVETHFVQEIIKREKPDGILLGFGGQTALNCGMDLEKKNILKKYHVQVLGTPIESIEKTEDRKIFTDTLDEINTKSAKSLAAKNLKEALSAAKIIKYPVMVRSAYSLGGQDSGVVNNGRQLKEIANRAFAKVNQILIEEYLAGWKEIEYEVVRDKHDNCITVCNMENLDPMGIHTGESIVTAPSQTLNDFEYHTLREIAIKVIRHLKIVGECNIQFALNPNPKTNIQNPQTLDYRIIEVNARLSRSSALASKATGYPLAYVAAKLALGYALVDIKNSINGTTTAAFEPALDYLVVKFPRWDLAKFLKNSAEIGSSMQSVGEVMAIGRKFEEALQKAIRMLDMGLEGLLDEKVQDTDYKNPTPWRLFSIAKSIKAGEDLKNISRVTGIDLFFLEKLSNIVTLEKKLKTFKLDRNLLKTAKQYGFSDSRIATITNSQTEKIRSMRKKLGINPSVKQIDTLAAEYPAKTNYLYLTYNGDKSDFKPDGKEKIIVLGSGPYRIGSSVEFDWCSVNAAQCAKENNIAPIIINCNPETVSTDYDMAEKLYFEELSAETIQEIHQIEKPKGIILSMGGQKPNNLAGILSENNVKILGTSAKSIDIAEDRNKFSKLCDELGIDQPPWAMLKDKKRALEFAQKIGFPALVRPSYVLSGAAMNVAFNAKDLENYLDIAANISTEHPVVISKFFQNAKELEIDAVACDGKILASAISEHVENAGVHSGDSTIILPSQKIYLETADKVEDTAKKIAKKLNITGPFNIQFLAIENMIMVIECNLRASRSLPFVSKVTGINFAKVATEAILNVSKNPQVFENQKLNYVGVKAPQFSFSRIKGADPILRVEMSSTGEVASFGRDLNEAFLKSLLAAGAKFPKKSVFISLAGDENKTKFLKSAITLKSLNLEIFATIGTSKFLKKHNLECKMLNKIYERKKPNILDYLIDKKIDLVINIIDPYFKKEFDDDYLIRRAAVDFGIPLLTNLQTAELFTKAIASKKITDLEVLPWSDYVTFRN